MLVCVVLAEQHERDGGDGAVGEARGRRHQVHEVDVPHQHHPHHGEHEGDHAQGEGRLVAVDAGEALHEEGEHSGTDAVQQETPGRVADSVVVGAALRARLGRVRVAAVHDLDKGRGTVKIMMMMMMMVMMIIIVMM